VKTRAEQEPELGIFGAAGGRSVVLGGHKTSVSLEDAFWKSLKKIAASGKMTVSELLQAKQIFPRQRVSHRRLRCMLAQPCIRHLALLALQNVMARALDAPK
jgi:predicted DNA-binding ribbon-helix-helix protein